ncbi:hypothetical protein QA641_13755 [Bradyrhizobium sp. CB1650]|uniref:hypothetical protein n=1 Tax=Bradyrhizobium sp. CB1650 TaxID=3039153 RepID=UPI00243517A6|nr:hypothetical protein [Bradyrhizobium sp. CB1650]WGD54883.1 hypothetical protein QA641_13755 [Bradyrhizobium sp. CB1650]
MRNRIDIDHAHSRAVAQLRQLEGDSLSIFQPLKRISKRMLIAKCSGLHGGGRVDSDHLACNEDPDLDQKSEACDRGGKKHITQGHGSAHQVARPSIQMQLH